MFNMLPLFAMQTMYYLRKNRKKDSCQECPYYINEDKCKKGKHPEFDYMDCYYND